MKEPLWVPSEERVQSAAMTRFIAYVNDRHGTSFTCYDELYRWSVNDIPGFWAAIWEFCGVRTSHGYERVVDDLDRMPGTRWFPGARLNFAENLLRYRDDRTAICFKGEGRETERISYGELFKRVARLAGALCAAGVAPGDRVAGFMPNLPETVIAMLAAVSLGAAWSSCSPEFGIQGVLDRFGQIAPKVLFCADGYRYNGQCFDSLGRVREIVRVIPTIERVVVVPYLEESPRITDIPRAVLYDTFVGRGALLFPDSCSCPPTTPSTSCTPRGLPALQSAWSRGPGESSFTT